MGNCVIGKQEARKDDVERAESKREYLPLVLLKKELMEKMGFQQDHPFKIFCNWRFMNSVRREEIFKRNLQKCRQDMLLKFNNFGNDRTL